MMNTAFMMRWFFGLEIVSLQNILVRISRLSHLIHHAVMPGGSMDRVCAHPVLLPFIRLCDATALARCNLAMYRIATVVELAFFNMRVGNQLRVSQQVTDAGLHPVVDAMQRAKCVGLNFSRCKHISDVGLRALAAALQHATSVSFNSCGCVRITDVGLQAIGRSLQQVTTLSLDFFDCMTSPMQRFKLLTSCRRMFWIMLVCLMYFCTWCTFKV